MKNIIDWLSSWFHHEVDDITKPLVAAVRRVEAFGAATRNKAISAETYARWAHAEAEKAARVAEKLRDLVS